jgi:hypothetical protein
MRMVTNVHAMTINHEDSSSCNFEAQNSEIPVLFAFMVM